MYYRLIRRISCEYFFITPYIAIKLFNIAIQLLTVESKDKPSQETVQKKPQNALISH